ncbi:hypothetical protein B566_EDAN004389 [Ephemera danica]|nr:hypothetical protein B566_EDAN004389 [Ephemera danica]
MINRKDRVHKKCQYEERFLLVQAKPYVCLSEGPASPALSKAWSIASSSACSSGKLAVERFTASSIIPASYFFLHSEANTSTMMRALVRLLALLTLVSAVYGQGVRSPLLQVWGVNLAGTRRLTPDEVWGVGLERVQHVAFDPDEPYRNRASYQEKFGPRGQLLIDMLGSGKHVDQVARELNNPNS